MLALLLGLFAVGGLLPQPAKAVLAGCGEGVPTPTPVAPPVQEPNGYAVSPGQVTMSNGGFNFSNIDIAIGSEGDAGISLARSLQLNSERVSMPMGSFTHNWDIQLREERQPFQGACDPSEYNYLETVTYEGHGETFYAYGAGGAPIFEQTTPKGYATLIAESYSSQPNGFVFTATDGTIVEFLPMQPKATSMCKGDLMGRCAYAERVTRPDGTVYDLTYETLTDGYSKRLKSVTSSRGLALLFEHVAADSREVSKACALNLGQQTLPASGLCPLNVPTATYTYANGVETATDAGGGVWQFSLDTVNQAYSLWRPGDSSAYVVNHYMLVGGSGDREKLKTVTSQSFIDGRTISYEWDVVSAQPGGSTQIIAGGAWDDGNGDRVELVYGRYTDPEAGFMSIALHTTPGPETVTDQIGRVWTYVFCEGEWGDACPRDAFLYSATAPEGNAKIFEYDEFWHLTQTESFAKPGSSLGSFQTSTAFPSFVQCLSSVLLCNKPTSTTDANGGVTDYEYDATHGGVTKVTAPADANGVRPQTRYVYAQRYAWVKASGSGYEQAASPVWLLTSEEYCRTSSASGGGCSAGASDEVVTTYDYGPDSGPNNLWLRGKAVTSDGVTLRTCYSYDGYGRMISETAPNANLSSCP